MQRTNMLLAEVVPEHSRVSYQTVVLADQEFPEATRRIRESGEVASRIITDLLKQLKDLSLVSQAVGSAVKISERRERAIHEAQEAAAKTAGRTAKEEGPQRRDRRRIQARVLGVPDVALNLSPRPAS